MPGKSARVMLELGSECSLIHCTLLKGCNLVYRTSGLKVQWDGGEVTIILELGSTTVTHSFLVVDFDT